MEYKLIVWHQTSIESAKKSLESSFIVKSKGFEDHQYFYNYKNLRKEFFHSHIPDGAVLEFEWPEGTTEKVESNSFKSPDKLKGGILYYHSAAAVCVAPSHGCMTLRRAAIGFPDKEEARRALLSESTELYLSPPDFSAEDERLIAAFGKNNRALFWRKSNIERCRDFFTNKIGCRFSVLSND